MDLIEFKEKHGSEYFIYADQHGYEAACHKVFLRREREGWYYEEGMDEDMLDCYRKAKEGDAKWAAKFMDWRRDYEYEEMYHHLVTML